MNYYLLNKKTLQKIFSFLLIILFLTNPLGQCTNSIKESEETTCYGFIIPLSNNTNYTTKDQTNCKIRHMINDMLREEIPVYWISTNITLKTKKINSSKDSKSINFEKGTFIIPFTGNITKNKKIVTMIYDYNQSSEIEIKSTIPISIYLILEPVTSSVYPLNEPKIALFKNRVTVGESLFLELLSKCGFLNYDIIWSKKINSKLNLDEYNLLIHAGGILDSFPYLFHYIYEDIVYKEADGVRAFVADGGGYIGSCGGLTKASAGGLVSEDIPIPIYFKRKVYNPKLRSIGLYAIADILIRPPVKTLVENQVKIVSNSSPVTYGLDKIVWDLHYGGPEIYKLGEDVEVISRFHETGTRFDNTPSWITSTFDQGKVIIFVNHPEIAGIYTNTEHKSMANSGKTAISNSIFYATSSDKITYQKNYSQDINFIEDIWNKTKDLTKSENETESVFESIRYSINKTKKYMTYLSSNVSRVISLIRDIGKKKKVDLTGSKNKYYIGLMYSEDIILYNNLLTQYLDKTNSVLDVIEQIYAILKNDTTFIQQFEKFTNNVSKKINKMQEIINESQNMLDDYERKLIKYKKFPFRFKLKENILKNKVMDIYLHHFSGFSVLPKNYFNSIKFLRNNWYKYELKKAK